MTSTQQKIFGSTLRALRERSGLTFRELAKVAGIHHSYLALVQAGRRGVGSAIAERIAVALGLTGFERAEFLGLAVKTRAAKQRTKEVDALRLVVGEWVITQLHGDLHPSNLMLSCKSCHEKLWTACIGDAEPQLVSPDILRTIETRPDRPLWLLLFLPEERQALVECRISFFNGSKLKITRTSRKAGRTKSKPHD